MTIPKYPLLFIHGMGFRDGKKPWYWGRIPKTLENEGCKVFFGKQQCVASCETNGREIAKRILQITKECGVGKVNVITHSKGGLDARCAAAIPGMAQYIASITTLSAPHNGSATMDALFRIPRFLKALSAAVTPFFRLLGDTNPEFLKCLYSFTTEGAKKFNEKYKAPPGVYCQSYAFDYGYDYFMFPDHLIVKHFEGNNDGLVSPANAEWENFRGVMRSNSKRGIAHTDIIDWWRRPLTKKTGKGISDITDFYKSMVRELAEMGF